MSDSDPRPEPGRPDPGEEVGANTEMWQAFAAQREPERPKAVGAPFRLLTLAAGLVAFVLIVWLLMR